MSAQRQGLGEDLEVGQEAGPGWGRDLGGTRFWGGGGTGRWSSEGDVRERSWGRKGVMEKRAEPVPVRHQREKQNLWGAHIKGFGGKELASRIVAAGNSEIHGVGRQEGQAGALARAETSFHLGNLRLLFKPFN